MILTLEEAKAQGIKIAGTEPYSEFVVSTKAYNTKNSDFALDIQYLLNKTLNLSEYSTELIKYLTIIFLIFPNDWQGVNWTERKYYKKSEKKFYIDIKFPDYEKFCNATKQEALKIMTEQTLRGTEKFLSKVKGFQFEKFYGDLEKVFSEMF